MAGAKIRILISILIIFKLGVGLVLSVERFPRGLDKNKEIIVVDDKWSQIYAWEIEYITEEYRAGKLEYMHYRKILVTNSEEFYMKAEHLLVVNHNGSETKNVMDPYSQELIIKNGKAITKRPSQRLRWESQMNEGDLISESLTYNRIAPLVPAIPIKKYIWGCPISC